MVAFVEAEALLTGLLGVENAFSIQADLGGTVSIVLAIVTFVPKATLQHGFERLIHTLSGTSPALVSQTNAILGTKLAFLDTEAFLPRIIRVKDALPFRAQFRSTLRAHRALLTFRFESTVNEGLEFVINALARNPPTLATNTLIIVGARSTQRLTKALLFRIYCVKYALSVFAKLRSALGTRRALGTFLLKSALQQRLKRVEHTLSTPALVRFALLTPVARTTFRCFCRRETFPPRPSPTENTLPFVAFLRRALVIGVACRTFKLKASAKR